MKNNYYVYHHIRLDKHEPFYVGKGKGDRAYKTWGRNKHWKRVIRKTDYRVEIIYSQLTEQQAFDLEIKVITNYKEFGYKLCNMTKGGEGTSGWIPSIETRTKISDTHKKAVRNNFGEAYESILDAVRKTGIKQSSISSCCRGRVKSAGVYDGEKIIWVFEEDKDTLKQRTLNANNFDAHKKSVRNNLGEVYESISHAARETGVNHTSISACCNGVRMSAGEKEGVKIIWVFEGNKNTLEQRVIEAGNAAGNKNKKVTNNFSDVYESLSAAARTSGVEQASISACCNGRLKSAGTLNGEKIVWVFEEDKHTLMRRVAEADSAAENNPKKVTNNFGDVYESIGAAAKESGVNRTAISACCLRNIKSAGKRNGEKIVWIFEDDKDTLEQRIVEANNDKPSGSPVRKVINNIGDIYDSLTDASRDSRVALSTISLCCNNKRPFAGTRNGEKLVWVFEEDKHTLEQRVIDANKDKPLGSQAKKVTNNLGDIYDSVANASRKTGVPKSTISACCLGKLKSAGKKEGAKLIWSFV